MQDTELRLVLSAIGGNAESFGRLAESYSSTLLGLAYTLTGDLEASRDIAQEALLKAYTSLATLQRPDRFGSWLRQIAANLARSHTRQQSRRPQVPLEDAPEEGAAVVDQTVERRLARAELLNTLQAVPEGPRAAVVMHYVVGLAPADAARQLGISRAAFDTRLSRGRDALRRELNRMMDETLTEARQEVAVYLGGIAERVKAALRDEPRERLAAAKELALLAARANLPRLIRDLRTHDETIRKNTARLLGDTLDRRAADALLQALQAEEEPSVQAELCRTLARIGVTAATPALQKLARNTADMTVHKAATEAARELAALAGAPAPAAEDIPVEIDDLKAGNIEDLFLAMLEDESGPVRVHAADGLGRVESVKAIPALAVLVHADPEEYVRRAAAEALGAITWPGRTSRDKLTPAMRAKAVVALAGALSDRDGMGVNAEAAWSLMLIAPEGDLRRQVLEAFHGALEGLLAKPGPWWASVPAMLEVLGGPDDQGKIAGILLRKDVRWKGPLTEALARMAKPGVTAANGLIAEAIRTHADPRCTHRLVEALGKSLDPSAIPLLTEALRGADAKAREAAAQALAGYPEGRPLLREVLDAGGDEPVLLAAATALASLGHPDDAAYLDAVADRLSPRARISVRAAVRRTAAK